MGGGSPVLGEQWGLLPAPCMGKVPPGCVPPQEVLVPLSPAQLEGRTGLLFPALHTDLQTCLRSFVCLVVIEQGGRPFLAGIRAQRGCGVGLCRFRSTIGWRRCYGA